MLTLCGEFAILAIAVTSTCQGRSAKQPSAQWPFYMMACFVGGYSSATITAVHGKCEISRATHMQERLDEIFWVNGGPWYHSVAFKHLSLKV